MGADISEAPQPASCFESLDAVVIGNELEAMVAAAALLDSGLSVIVLGSGERSERPAQGAASQPPSHSRDGHEVDGDSAAESRHDHSPLGSELLSGSELIEAIEASTQLIMLHSPNGDPPRASTDRELLSVWLGRLSISSSTRSYLELLSRVVLAAEPTETSATDAISRLADASRFQDAVRYGLRYHEARTLEEIEERMHELHSHLGWRVITDVAVQDVRASDDGVQVSTTDGALRTQSAIVVSPRSRDAVPGLTASSSVEGEDHAQPPTNLFEVRLRYKTSLWGQLAGSGSVLNMGGLEALVFDSSHLAEDEHILVAYMQGSHADAFRVLSSSDRRSALVDAVSLHLGDQAQVVEQYVEIDWSTVEVSPVRSDAEGTRDPGSDRLGGPELRVRTLASLPMVNSAGRLRSAVDRGAFAARLAAVHSAPGTGGASADWMRSVLDWRESQVGSGSVRAHPTSAVARELIGSSRCGHDLLQALVHTLDSGFGDGEELNRLLSSTGAGFRIFECRNLAGPYWDFEPTPAGLGAELESSRP